MPEGGGGELVAGAPRGKGAAVVLQLLHVPTGTARRGLGDSGRGRRLQDVRLVFDDAGLAAVFLALTNELAASARSSPLERRELRLRFQKAVKAVMSEEGRAETRKSVSEEEGSSGAGRMPRCSGSRASRASASRRARLRTCGCMSPGMGYSSSSLGNGAARLEPCPRPTLWLAKPNRAGV